MMKNFASLGILIVDDDLGDRKSIRRALQRSELPCEIYEAEDIPEATALCGEHAIDCIFLDYNLPRLTGIDGIQHLKEAAPGTPIIMATGQGDELVATMAIKGGATDYLPKRLINATAIRKAVEHVVEVAELERELREQQEALASFSHMLAHDLKAPVRHISIIGESLSQALEERDYARATDLQAMMRKMANRIDLLLVTLTQYNNAHAQNVIFEPVPLKTALEGAAENLKLEIQQSGAQITEGELPHVTGNLALLIQLFQNLIGNAIKFCRASHPLIHVSATEREREIHILVRDNGIGIDAQYVGSIFEPFKRLHASGEFPGTGLGLATCQKIVQRHKGRIWCESAEGNGSTFFIALPSNAMAET